MVGGGWGDEVAVLKKEVFDTRVRILKQKVCPLGAKWLTGPGE